MLRQEYIDNRNENVIVQNMPFVFMGGIECGNFLNKLSLLLYNKYKIFWLLRIKSIKEH